MEWTRLFRPPPSVFPFQFLSAFSNDDVSQGCQPSGACFFSSLHSSCVHVNPIKWLPSVALLHSKVHKTKNKRGERTQPCGAPDDKTNEPEPFTRASCFLCATQSDIHRATGGSKKIKCFCSISNAEEATKSPTLVTMAPVSCHSTTA